MSPFRRSLPAALLALAAGCSDGGSTPNDAATSMDGSTPNDAAPADAAPTDAGDSSTPSVRPRAVVLSPNGHDRLYGVAWDARGGFLAVGPVADGTAATDDQRTALVRFTASGELDRAFGAMGVATANLVPGGTGEVARGVVVQPSGKVVVAATVEAMGAMDPRDRNVALARFNADGTRDMTFGTNGLATLDLGPGAAVDANYVADGMWHLASYPDGRLVVTGTTKRAAGTDSDFFVARLTVDGARDVGFGTGGVFTLDINNRDATARTTTVLPDGSLLSAGYMTESSVVRPVVFKLTPAGALDPSFGTMGVFSRNVLGLVTEAYAAALQGTSLVTAGYGRDMMTESVDWLSLRITPAGALDTTYGAMGVARLDRANFNDNCRTLAVLPDNRVLLVGGGRGTESDSDGMLGMLTPNGARDTSFGANGLMTFDLGGGSDFFWGAALSPDGASAAVVGAKGVGSAAGHDDGAVLVLPLRR